jgi:TatD DNase family protein
LALKHDLPVAIHTRDAFPEILDEVERMQNGRLKGVFHCFSGSLRRCKAHHANEYVDGNWWRNHLIKKPILAEVVKSIPMEFLLLETDSPFLAPAPFRGKRNESGYLIYIAQKLAEIKGLPIEKVAEATTANALQLFKI